MGPCVGLGGTDFGILVQVLPGRLHARLEVVGEEAARGLEGQAVILGGPRWDAMAAEGRPECVLVEADDHPDAALLGRSDHGVDVVEVGLIEVALLRLQLFPEERQPQQVEAASCDGVQHLIASAVCGIARLDVDTPQLQRPTLAVGDVLGSVVAGHLVPRIPGGFVLGAGGADRGQRKQRSAHGAIRLSLR
jgi:hypothetical protein